METFNGFEPGETRTHTFRPLKADKGHTIVKRTKTRRGSSWSFAHRETCQCGKSFGSKGGYSQTSTFYRYMKHLREEGVL